MNRVEQEKFRHDVLRFGLKGAAISFGVAYETAKRLNNKYLHIKPKLEPVPVEYKELSWFEKRYKLTIYLYIDGIKKYDTIRLTTYKKINRLFEYQSTLGFTYDDK